MTRDVIADLKRLIALKNSAQERIAELEKQLDNEKQEKYELMESLRQMNHGFDIAEAHHEVHHAKEAEKDEQITRLKNQLAAYEEQAKETLNTISKGQIGHGDDPIGFVLAAYPVVCERLVEAGEIVKALQAAIPFIGYQAYVPSLITDAEEALRKWREEEKT